MAQTFNNQQREAIQSLGENIIVSASAGAGKTTVLIARLMKRILEDGVSIDRICALTFTDAAANEMKKRLLAALYERHAKEPTEYLEQQMMLVETAHISTIHAFCLSIIKNHGYLLGISDEMTQNILDPAMVTLYQKQAFNDTMENWAILRRDDLKKLLQTFAPKPQDIKPFFNTIMTVSKLYNSKHNKHHLTEQLLQTYSAKTFDAMPPFIQTAYFQHHQLHITLICEQLQALIQCTDAIENQEELSQYLLTHYEQLQNLRNCIQAHDLSFVQKILPACNIKLKTLRNQPEYKQLGDFLAETIKGYIETVEPLQSSIETLNAQVPLLNMIIEFVLAYQERFQQIKREMKGLDFDDFEHLAYELLTINNAALSYELKQQFDEIMVDEFQDTNDFQDAIIQLISSGSNIFRVGDIKQSIYRFRGAKPSIMQDLMQDASMKNIYLSYNYRSKEDIVNFNNDFFSTILNLTSGMMYTENDTVDTGIPAQKNNTAPVEFLIVTDPETLEANPGTLPWDKDRNMRKARVIAQEVLRHHAMGYSFRDIVILVRSHAQKVFLKRAFEETNIPHFIDDRGGFYQSSIVSSILSFFNFILDETDYSLVNVLKSPFIGYSFDALASLKIHSPSSLYTGLKSYDFPTYTLLKQFKAQWQSHDAVSCILDIINLNDAYHKRLSIQDKTNVDALLEKAIAYQASNNPTLTGFMEFVMNLDDDKSPEAIPLSDNDDVVTAMTIHQSKGLQFPVVILWSMGRRTNRNLQGTLITDDQLGIALTDSIAPLKITRSSILKTLIQTKQDAEDLEETMRLVYVALTRPQERLIVIDVLKNYNESVLNHSLLYSYKHMIDLLTVVSSIHRTVTIESYNSIPYRILQPMEKEETAVHFTPPDLSYIESAEIEHGNFTFNPLFLEATEYGSQLHKAVETLPQRTWQETDLTVIPIQFHKALWHYNSHPFTQLLYTAEEKIQEMPFIITEGNKIQNGIIDAYYVFDTTLVIVDYKTDSIDIDTLKTRYASQLQVYRRALEKEYPTLKIQTFIYSFHNKDYIELL